MRRGIPIINIEVHAANETTRFDERENSSGFILVCTGGIISTFIDSRKNIKANRFIATIGKVNAKERRRNITPPISLITAGAKYQIDSMPGQIEPDSKKIENITALPDIFDRSSIWTIFLYHFALNIYF